MTKGFNPQLLFIIFKYAIYLLLTMDIYHFFAEEYAAFDLAYVDGYTLSNILTGYNATIDTVAWVLLLYLFELETFIIDDEKIVGWTKWSMHGVRAICYFFIISACYQYVVRYEMFSAAEPFLINDVCSLVGTSYTYALTMDEYIPWTFEICASVTGQPLLQLTGTEIISTIPQHDIIIWLALIDIVNSNTWLIVILVLEVDVWLQLKGKLTPRLMKISKFVKATVYTVLILCAVLWGYYGDFLDFGDAFLWLLGFFFIELNIFDWNEETQAETAQSAHQQTDL